MLTPQQFLLGFAKDQCQRCGYSPIAWHMAAPDGMGTTPYRVALTVPFAVIVSALAPQVRWTKRHKVDAPKVTTASGPRETVYVVVMGNGSLVAGLDVPFRSLDDAKAYLRWDELLYSAFFDNVDPARESENAVSWRGKNEPEVEA